MDRHELEITAALAQLDLQEDELIRLGEAVDEMLTFFQKMEELDVDELDPTTHALIKKNRLRSDEIVDSDLADDMLDNAPDLEDRLIVIPNVL